MKNTSVSLITCAILIVGGCGGGKGATAPQSVTPPNPNVNPQANNKAPIASNDSVTTSNGIISIAVLSNDSDPDGDLMSIVLVGRPAHGEVQVDNNGTPDFTGDDQLVYTAAAGYVGTDLFTYTISDGADGRANGFVTVNVSASTGSIGGNTGNAKPWAQSDNAITSAQTAIAVDVLANDTDTDGDVLSLFGYTAPTNGIVRLDNNGTPADATDDHIIYTPNQGFVGTDSFSYTITDNQDVALGLVNLQVTDVSGSNNSLTEQVCGVVMIGPVNGAEVTLSKTDDQGTHQGGPIAKTRTDAFGQWCVELAIDRPMLLVDARGGAYLDPADSRYSQGNARLIQLEQNYALQTVLPSDANYSALTVFSNALLLKSRIETQGGDFANVFASNRSQAESAFGFDIFTTPVADPAVSTPGATDQARQYAMAVGAAVESLNQLAVDLKVAAPNFILVDALIRDLSECRLNGLDHNGPVTVSMSGQSLAISNNIDLNLQIVRFRNNYASTYQGVSMLQIDQPTCSTVVASADVIGPQLISVPNNLRVVPLTGTSEPLISALIQQFLSSVSALDDRDGIVPVSVALQDGLPLPASFPFGATAVVFSAVDSAGNQSVPLVRIIELVQSGPPQVFPDLGSTLENTATTIDVLANDVGLNHPLDTSSVAITVAPKNGDVTVSHINGQIHYLPHSNFSGADTFQYSVADTGGVRSLSVTVRIDVIKVNAAPTVIDDVASTVESVAVTITALGNDSDVDGVIDVGSLTIVSGPTNGMAVVDFSSGAIVYSPTPGFVGNDSLTYTVADIEGQQSNPGTVMITVLAAQSTQNFPPTVINDIVFTLEDAALPIAVLLNDIDDDGQIDASSVSIVAAPSRGHIASIDTDGVVYYVPNTNYAGADSFTYQVKDDQGAPSAPATVHISIMPVNDAPVIVDDIISGIENSTLSAAILANDFDPDGILDVSVTLVTAATFGNASWDAGSAMFNYLPNLGFNGTDQVSYRVEDAQGLTSALGIITINVTGVNDPPVAVDDALAVFNTLSQSINFIANDSDADGAIYASNVTITQAPTQGILLFDDATSEWLYTATSSYVGNDSFKYRIFDANGAISEEATVSLDVAQGSVAPQANNDVANALEFVATVIEVLNNDSDVNGFNGAVVTINDAPMSGLAIVNNDNTVAYTSDDNFSGPDSFTYSITDSSGLESNFATVTVAVTDVPEPPMASPDSAQTDENTSTVINVLANDIDVENNIDLSSVTIQSMPSNGTAIVNTTTGSISYQPNTNFNGPDSFTYRVRDSGGLQSATVTVSISVIAQPSAPQIIDATASVEEDSFVDIMVLSGSSDPENDLDSTTVEVVQDSLNGATTAFANGTVRYTPTIGFTGADWFTFRVQDATGLYSNVSTINITVNQLNLAPTANNHSGEVILSGASYEFSVAAYSGDLDGSVDLTSVVTSGESTGSSTIDPVTGIILFTPDALFTGVASFNYTVRDNDGNLSNLAMVEVVVWPAEDADFDGVSTAIETDVGTNPSVADSVYVYIDADTPATLFDGSSWELAYPSVKAASDDGALVDSPGNTVYVLIADNSSVADYADEWVISANANCSDFVIIGSLDPYVSTPKTSASGTPLTTLSTGVSGQRIVDIKSCVNFQVRHVVISGGNGVARGAGVKISDSVVTLDSVNVQENLARREGAGVYVVDSGSGAVTQLDIVHSVIEDNVVTPISGVRTYGAGLSAEDADNVSIVDTRIIHNRVNVFPTGPHQIYSGGGGIYIDNSALYVSESTISANISEGDGGGLRFDGSSASRVEHSVISGNEARINGGGIHLSNTTSSLVLHNNLITSNFADDDGGALYFTNAAGTILRNNTAVYNLADRDGGGLHTSGASANLDCNIANYNVANNSGQNVSGSSLDLLALDANYNFVDFGAAGAIGVGNTSADVRFDTAYYLNQASSPAVDYCPDNSDAPLVALQDRYTDSLGFSSDVATTDAGFHYSTFSADSADQLLVLVPADFGRNQNNLRMVFSPLVNGVPIGPGHRIYADTNSSNATLHLYALTSDTIDPLATGESTQLTDIGNGNYELLLDTTSSSSDIDIYLFIDQTVWPDFGIEFEL